MAYSRLPQVYIWGETPTTPARLSQQTDDDFDDGPHTPCDFMPQSSAPVMILSSTTRRTRKSVDERAIRLLLPAPDGFQNTEYHTDDEEEEANGTGEQEERRDFLEINKTPKTPPRTPLTPNTDTSLASATSFASFAAVAINFRLSRRGVFALVTALALALMSLAAFAVLRTEGLLNGLMDLLRCVWKILVFLSEAAEIAIEGVGFALGRAVAQFGRGFEHGYHM